MPTFARRTPAAHQRTLIVWEMTMLSEIYRQAFRVVGVDKWYQTWYEMACYVLEVELHVDNEDSGM